MWTVSVSMAPSHPVQVTTSAVARHAARMQDAQALRGEVEVLEVQLHHLGAASAGIEQQHQQRAVALGLGPSPHASSSRMTSSPEKG